MKRGIINLFLIFAFILTISMVSASFSIGKPNHTIETTYAPGDSVRGWINLSLTSEPVNSIFETSNGGSASLIDLIMQNPSFQYTCSPTDCAADFSSADEVTTKNLIFDAVHQGFFVGFKITGKNFEGISNNGFSLKMTSNAPESSLPQLIIEILNDGITDWQSYTPSTNFQGENYGCYVAPATPQTAEITQTSYCEKIHLQASPSVKIGAKVIDILPNIPGTGNDGTAIFSLSIQDEDENYGYCEKMATASGTVECSPKNGNLDFRINEEKNYYVCIKAKSSADNSDYKINYEGTNPPICGYAGSEANPNDFEIFANPAKYAALGTINLNNAEIENYLGYSTDIASSISDYIANKYNNNCTNGCIIPIKIIGTTQSLTLSDALLSYTAGQITTSTNLIYDLQESDANVTTSKYQKLNLDNAGLIVPQTFGDNDFTLTFKNQNIFSEKISIKKIPRILSLSPNIVMAAYPATFTVDVNTYGGEVRVIQYEWTFDDGTETTIENTVTHTFPNVGTYNLSVKIKDSNNVTSSRDFAIIAEVPINAINLDLTQKNESIKQLTSYVNTLPLFYKNSIKSVLNLTEIEAQLKKIQARNKIATSDQDYINIMKDLMTIKVPKNISTSKKAMSIPFYTKKDAVNVDALKDISSYSKTIKNEDIYKNAVIGWNNKNIATKIDFNEISANYNDEDVPLLRFFDATITKKQSLDYNSYFVIPQLENLKYAEDYSKSKTQGYDYIELTQDETHIVFSTTEDVNFVNLPAFVTPKISDLSLLDINIIEDENNNIWIIILLIAITLVIGLIVYLILQRWYMNKYEDYLFKNKNDLYNLVSYVQTARRTGISEGELTNRLKKAKWKTEQIRYVLRKGIGKNPGMFEIFKFKRRE